MGSSPQTRQAFEQAARLMQEQRAPEADPILRRALTQEPTNPNLLRLLGVALIQQQKFADAEKQLKLAIQFGPSLAVAHEDLGSAIAMQGRLKEAVACFDEALKCDPKLATAHMKRGKALASMGQGEQADKSIQEALNLTPGKARMVEAMEHHKKGDRKSAQKILREILYDEPKNIDAMRLLGVLAADQKNFEDAEAYFRQTIELAPDFSLAWTGLAQAYKEQGKFDEAREAIKEAIKLEPDNSQSFHGLGAIESSAGHHKAAIAAYRKALDIQPKSPGCLLGLGHALKTLGEQEESIDAYRGCIALKPDFGEVYWSLANLKTFRFTDAEIEEMLKQIEREKLDDRARIHFYFSLAKSFDDAEDYHSAWKYYDLGNQEQRGNERYDMLKNEMAIDGTIDVFTKDFYAEHAGEGCPAPDPILIVGLPRSGSTLLEQIICSHSQVEGTAELPDLAKIGQTIGQYRRGHVRYPQAVADLKADEIMELGEEYIQRTMQHRSGKPFFTDKMPNNFSLVGLMCLILPNAKIIDARRHPLDSCLGSYKQLFARGQPFTYDIMDLSEYYKQYVRVMDHWDTVLPGKVLRVNYEDVVDDLEGQARRIINYLGLPWEDPILNFYDTKRAVRTASSEQVRQPIYSKARHFWRNYEDDLGEFIDYLEPVIRRLPENAWPKSMKEN